MDGSTRATGTVIAGRYVLEKLLGAGAFGEVWSARDEKAFQRRVAIKFLLEQHVHNPEVVARFWREGEATAALSHPNVVTLLEFGDDGGGPYLVSEFVDGVSLRTILERSVAGTPHMALAECLEIFRQTCAGVAAAHANNIVHRDLKPENVMVQRERASGRAHVKVLDFGIARMLNADAQSKIKARTGAGQVLGSPQYMSPEQLVGDVKSVDARSDVFALGALLYETLTLQPAFAGTQFFEVVTAILEEPRPVITRVRADLPPDLDAVIARATAVKPDERFATVDALREAVDAAFAAAQPAPEPEPPRRQNTSRMRRLSDAIPAQREEWRLDAGDGASASTPEGRSPGDAGAPNSDPVARGAPAAGHDGGSSAALIAALVTVLVAAAAGAWFTPARGRLLALFHHGDAPATGPGPAGSGDAAARAAAAEAPPAAAAPAHWVHIAAPATPFRLGRLTHHEAHVGFAPGAGDLFSGPAFEIQDREVTFGEYEAFAREHAEQRFACPAWAPQRADARAGLPAVGMGIARARAYCQAQGGDLPTEAQWEYAARGPARRLNPWGDGAPPGDVAAFRGPAATLESPGSCSADRTPEGVMDLAGSVPEWTATPWRADDAAPGAESATGGAYAVRGLPLREARPHELPAAGLYRQEGCGEARCSAAARAVAEGAGFRCARPAAP